MAGQQKNPKLWLNKIVLGVDMQEGQCVYIAGPNSDEGTVIVSHEDFIKIASCFKQLNLKLTQLKKSERLTGVRKFYGA